MCGTRSRGSLPTAVAVLDRWPHLDPARRRAPLHVDRGGRRAHPRRAGRAGTGRGDPRGRGAWAAFWDGHLDLDALAFDVTEHLRDMADAKARTDRATEQAQRYGGGSTAMTSCCCRCPGWGRSPPVWCAAFLADAHRVRHGEGGRQLCRVEPVDLVVGHRGAAQPGDHQGRAGGAAAGVLPGRERGPPAPTRSWPRSTTG